MRDLTEMLVEDADELRLRRIEGGFEPEEGVEVSVVIDTGASALALESVTRILTRGDAWIVCREGGDEVAWVRPESVVMIRAKGVKKGAVRSRPGFA